MIVAVKQLKVLLSPMLSRVSLLLQIFLLVIFMCVTLLLASLICLTLPGMLSHRSGFFLVLTAVFFMPVFSDLQCVQAAG